MTKEFNEKMEETFESFLKNKEFSDNFVAGAIFGIVWFTDNIWHDVSEEPKLNSTIVIEWAIDKHISIAEFKGYVSYSKNRFRVQSDLGYSEISVSKWCYLDDILPQDK